MAKSAQQQRKRNVKTSSTTIMGIRRTLASQMKTTKLRSRARSRTSKSQVANVTEKINGEFAQVQYFHLKPQQSSQNQAASLPDSSVQDLADIMSNM
ncbi:hypothetical protein BD414DRAFT_411315 [Trametes punicea]|nr:hypothetical protein BD414DRAFT_411315 [Trametes punicea]